MTGLDWRVGVEATYLVEWMGGERLRRAEVTPVNGPRLYRVQSAGRPGEQPRLKHGDRSALAASARGPNNDTG